jgi:hypothetical protein
MIIEQLLFSMETVPLAKIDNLIQAELQSRAEYALRYGVHRELPKSTRRRIISRREARAHH